MDKAVYGQYRGLLYNKIPDLQGKATKSWWYVCHLKGWLPFIWHRRVLDKLLSNRTQQFSRRTKDLQVIHCGWRKQCCNSGGPCLFRHIHNYQENHGWVGTRSWDYFEDFAWAVSHASHAKHVCQVGFPPFHVMPKEAFSQSISTDMDICNVVEDNFLSLVTVDKCWLHIYACETKIKSKQFTDWLLWTNVRYISVPLKQTSNQTIEEFLFVTTETIPMVEKTMLSVFLGL